MCCQLFWSSCIHVASHLLCLHCRVGADAKLAPHEVVLRVTAVGLNFRDVLNVLGMYPGDPGDPGGDCAGIVTAAGTSAGHK